MSSLQRRGDMRAPMIDGMGEGLKFDGREFEEVEIDFESVEIRITEIPETNFYRGPSETMYLCR